LTFFSFPFRLPIPFFEGLRRTAILRKRLLLRSLRKRRMPVLMSLRRKSRLKRPPSRKLLWRKPRRRKRPLRKHPLRRSHELSGLKSSSTFECPNAFHSQGGIYEKPLSSPCPQYFL
jgi:hypothetical protein